MSEVRRVKATCLWSAGLAEWSWDPGAEGPQASTGKFPGLPVRDGDILGDISLLSMTLLGYSMALSVVGHF